MIVVLLYLLTTFDLALSPVPKKHLSSQSVTDLLWKNNS